MLRDLDMKPGTVKRYIADIRSMVNLGLRENDMSNVGNPFNGLPIKMETLVVDERHPIPEEMLPAINGCQRRSKNRPRGGAKVGHYGAGLRPPGGLKPERGSQVGAAIFEGSFSRPFGRDFERDGSCRRSSRGC